MVVKVLFNNGEPKEVIGKKIEDRRLFDRAGYPVIAEELPYPNKGARIRYREVPLDSGGKIMILKEGQTISGRRLDIFPYVELISHIPQSKER